MNLLLIIINYNISDIMINHMSKYSVLSRAVYHPLLARSPLLTKSVKNLLLIQGYPPVS